MSLVICLFLHFNAPFFGLEEVITEIEAAYFFGIHNGSFLGNMSGGIFIFLAAGFFDSTRRQN